MPDTERTVGRSRAYGLLAEAFTFPQSDAVIRLLDGDLLAELKLAFELTGYDIQPPETLTLPSAKNAIQEIQVIYTELFDVTSGSPKVSLLERRYREIPEQELWEKLLRFYSYFGLDFSQGGGEEQPDHLLTELGFMHYLTFLEAGCSSDSDRVSFMRGQRDFLQLHLGKWIEKFTVMLAETTLDHPYTDLARRLTLLINNDLIYLAANIPGESKTDGSYSKTNI